MAVITSFAPIETPEARVLIVGSIPGERSLRAGQYYAHPQNAFWQIVAGFCGFDAAAAYAERVRQLGRAGIAVWDVLQTCERTGSLDADIRPESERPNDLIGFCAGHRELRGILCNGNKAFAALQRFLRARDRGLTPCLEVVRLPSTSPAHASLSRAAKERQWHAALTRLLCP